MWGVRMLGSPDEPRACQRNWSQKIHRTLGGRLDAVMAWVYGPAQDAKRAACGTANPAELALCAAGPAELAL
ncbi:hypothetical protein LBMAG53_26180 [Planctomycetota bacterium]|nr:hypothetical protein LBMAG53_26180 [Planctomycetota bacterium]